MTAEEIKVLLFQWEQYKKANWYESDAINVEGYLIHQFAEAYAALTVAEATKQSDELRMPYKCPVCDGRGLVPYWFYNTFDGTIVTTSISEVPCRSCNGMGYIVI